MWPYIFKLAKVIKYAAPVAGAAAGVITAGPGGAVIGAAAVKKLAAQIKLMEELAKKLADRDYMEAPDRKASKLTSRVNSENREAHIGDKFWVGGKAERIEGMELRALRKLLDEVDAKQEWGGLKKVLTPEGHYLWLCKEHAEEYKK